MSDGDLRRELQQLAARLGRIEQRLGIAPEEAAAPPQQTAAPLAHERAESGKGQAFHRLFQSEPSVQPVAPVIAMASAPPTAPPPAAPPTAPPPVIAAPPRREPAITPLQPAPPPLVAAPAHAARESFTAESAEERKTGPESVLRDLRALRGETSVAQSERSSASWEMLIGGKWMAWVGALVVILAAGFAVKVGFDQGWWGHLSPELRCLGIAAFGLALLGGGEIALRRIGKPAAAGLISAGLGTLYLDAYAAARVFAILSIDRAFILMAIVVLGGFAMTVRTRFLTIGVLSIVGGYVTPILLAGETSHDLALLLYLTMLLGVSLALSGAVYRPFASLRFVALAGHMLIAFGWLLANSAKWEMAMFFMSAWWTMTLAESVYTALKGRAATGNVVMTLLATAAYVTGGCLVLSGSTASAEWTGAFTAMVAVLGALAALQFGSGWDALRDATARRRSAMDVLAIALWLQFGVLIATAIGLQFDGFGQAIGWLAMGLAAVEMGRRLPSRGVTLFGLVIGALATLCVITMPVLRGLGVSSTILQPLSTIAAFEVSPWAILAIINVLAMHVAAHRLPRTSGWRTMRIVLVALASVMWLGVAMNQASGLTVTAAWLLYGVAVLAFERLDFARSASYLQIALAVLAATAARWLTVDALLPRLDPSWRADSTVAFLNWQMALAVAIAAAGWWACRVLGRRERERLSSDGDAAPAGGPSMFWQVVLLGGAVFGLIAICFEIDRGVSQAALARAARTFSPEHARQLLFTLCWAMGSVVIAVIARTFAGRVDGSTGISRTWLLRRFAWSVLSICAVKWIVLDAPMLFTMNRSLFDAAHPLLNLQMIVGMALAGAVMAMSVIIAPAARPQREESSAMSSVFALPRDLASWMPVLACAIVLWGLTFEVDRLLSQIQPLPHWLAAFPPLHLRALWWTALWLIGGAAMFGIGVRRTHAALFGSGTVTAALCAIAWLTVGSVAWRMTDPPVAVMPVLNLQFAVGGLCAIALAAMARIVRALPAPSDGLMQQQAGRFQPRLLAQILLALTGAIGLWLGSIEIDRIFVDQPMVQQAGLSVWWALYAVGLVVLGFAKRPPMAAVRYTGLALLSLTAVKVLLIDFANLDQLPRVLSFAGAGLLLILTSIVYAKLSPKLLREEGR